MIELKNIYKTYKMGEVEVRALHNVSLKISTGEFVAIMGPSGSGKSTLMHILGLLDHPDSGSYLLGGRELSKLSDEQSAVIRNRFVGFIFQQFHLLPRLTALENVELPLVYAGKRHLIQKAREEIEKVGLSERLTHRPNELSGGQQQRVAIARSLVNDPIIILADEPTGNLDSKSKEDIIGVLKKLNQEGKTVVIVTHEKEVAQHAQRIILFRDGEIVSDQEQGILKDKTKASVSVAGIEQALAQSGRRIQGVKFLDYCREAGFAMISHKMRSVLSILGVLIGVAAVIAMLALGEGAKASIEEQLASLGSNLIVVRAGSAKVHGIAMGAGAVTRFTFKDVDIIAKLSGVKRISPAVTGRGQLVYGNKNWSTQIDGADADYAQMRAYEPAVGRFFTSYEVKTREKLAVIGTTIARELFGEDNPVGSTMKINLINFKIIGVLPSKGANSFHDQDDTVIIPVTTAMYRVFGKDYIDSIFVEAEDPKIISDLMDEITGVITKEHRLTKNDEDSFQIRDMSDIKKTLEATTKTMSLLLGSIAAISLLVGGIGIMNIMLVSVTERTREIGLRKAIGANNRDIMIQFLIEAIMMSLIGGLSGVALGTGVSVLVTMFTGWSVRVSLFSVILATVFSFIVGIVFGLWPAKQASRLDSIEALRYE